MNCPRCGQPINRAPAELLAVIASIDMPRREHRLAEALLGAFPRRVTTSTAAGAVYDDESEDYLDAAALVWSHTSKLRRRLRGTGWTITSKRFDGIQFARDTGHE